jgi:hypothetical protein
MVSGKLWDLERDRPPAFVVLTDTNGVIRGVGELVPGGADHRGTWVGFVAGYHERERYAVYGVLAGEPVACGGGIAAATGP